MLVMTIYSFNTLICTLESVLNSIKFGQLCNFGSSLWRETYQDSIFIQKLILTWHISVDAIDVLLVDHLNGLEVLRLSVDLTGDIFLLGIFLKLSLHVGNGVSVDLTLDGRRGFDDVKVLEEVIEADHALL